MIEWIEELLFRIGNLLHLPVFLGLLLMVVWVVWSIGAFAAEWRSRRKQGRVSAFMAENEVEIARILAHGEAANINLTKLVQAWKKAENTRLDRIRFLIKITPSLNLVETLIPMGQSLSTLSTSDM